MADESVKPKICILRASIHCEGCKKKVKKILSQLPGVEFVDVDAKQHKVTVTGDVDADALVKKLVKSGKNAELWPQTPPIKREKEKEKEIKPEASTTSDNGKPSTQLHKLPNKNPPSEGGESGGGGGGTGNAKTSGDVQPEEKKSVESCSPPAGDHHPPQAAEKNDGGGGTSGKKKKKKGRSGTNHVERGLENREAGPPPAAANQSPPPPPRDHRTPFAPAPLPAYAVSYNTAYPAGSYAASYYAAPPPHGYAQVHPGMSQPPPLDHGLYPSQPLDSFEMFSDENPNGCFIM